MSVRFRLNHRYEMALLSTLILQLTFSNSGCKENSTTVVNSYYNQNLLDPTIKPIPKWTYPPTNGIGPYDLYLPTPNNQIQPHFFVQFNKLMKYSSFTMKTVHCIGFSQPVIVRILNISYYNTPQFSDLIYFEVVDSQATYQKGGYVVGTQYTVTIDTSVEDVNGNHMTAPYSFSFTPEPNLRILLTYPNNGDTINAYTQPQISFNSPVGSMMRSALSISPSITGTWFNSYDSLSFVFQPDSGLRSDTAYTITVNQGAEDNYNHPLPQQFTLTFNTYSFQILSTEPRNGTIAAYLDRMYFYLSAPIDTATIRIAIGINPPTSGTFSLLYGKQGVINFYPIDDFTPNSPYQVTISKLLKAEDGSTLSNDFAFTFSTPSFLVRSSSPKDRATNVNRTSQVRISFNGRIDTASIQSVFSITPNVAGHFIQGSQSEFSFVPDTSLASFTAYQVIISMTMRSIGGYNLSQPYSFTFATRP